MMKFCPRSAVPGVRGIEFTNDDGRNYCRGGFPPRSASASFDAWVDTVGLMSRRHSGWKALAEAVAPGARITRLRRLSGGAGGTDAYDVTLDREPRRVVVKLYPDGDGTASLEWSRLEFAQRVSAPVPESIAADLGSVWFGRPAVVMSRLPGRPDVSPKDAGR